MEVLQDSPDIFVESVERLPESRPLSSTGRRCAWQLALGFLGFGDLIPRVVNLGRGLAVEAAFQARDEQGHVQPFLGDLVAVGSGFFLDDAVAAQPAQVICHLTSADLSGGDPQKVGQTALEITGSKASDDQMAANERAPAAHGLWCYYGAGR